MTRLLVIEDDENIASFIQRGLCQRGFDVEVAVNGFDGLCMAQRINPEIVILDLILPDMDGIDICREIRSSGDMGILILTARHMVSDRVLGLEAGADDYLSKPFAFDELVARIRSILRRRSSSAAEIITVDDLEINTKIRQVRRASRLIELTNREFELLKLLAENKGRPVRRETILMHIWGSDYETDTDPVKVYITFLRKKLNAGGEEDLLHSLRGYGYVLRSKT